MTLTLDYRTPPIDARGRNIGIAFDTIYLPEEDRISALLVADVRKTAVPGPTYRVEIPINCYHRGRVRWEVEIEDDVVEVFPGEGEPWPDVGEAERIRTFVRSVFEPGLVPAELLTERRRTVLEQHRNGAIASVRHWDEMLAR